VEPVPASTSTIPPDQAPRWQRFERVLRWFAVTVVVAIVAAAMLGFAGLRLGDVAAQEGNLDVGIRYAKVSRPGIATPFTIDVATRDGRPLPARVGVAINSDYLTMFDENGLDPEPVTTDADSRRTYLTFEPTRGHSSLAIDFDARLQPDIHRGKDGTVTVRAGGDRVALRFRTRVAP
jgi:hypothetical protein